MPSNKDRLYVALYARGGGPQTSALEATYVKYKRDPEHQLTPSVEASYHWALLSGPKAQLENQRGFRYHVKQRIIPPQEVKWFFEEVENPRYVTSRLLVRIAIAKIENLERVREILRNIPVRQESSDWTCKAWVKEALEQLDSDADALGTRAMEWERVQGAALSYCSEKKEAHRFDGQGNFDTTQPPTFDLMKNKETIP